MSTKVTIVSSKKRNDYLLKLRDNHFEGFKNNNSKTEAYVRRKREVKRKDKTPEKYEGGLI